MDSLDVTVIGAGVGGLAAAIRMAARGYSVTVYEKNAVPGGKIGEIRQEGFRFDTGPSLFTLPFLVDELLALGQSKDSISFSYKKLDTVCLYFFEDGTRIEARSNPAQFADELALRTGESRESVLNYLRDTEKLYEASADIFIFNPLRRIVSSAWHLSREKLKSLLVFNPFRSMHLENRRRFKSPHVIQLFDRYATYNGSSPYRAPATLSVISHLEHNLGAFYPDKGLFSIVEALYAKALSLGVTFRFNARVTGFAYSKGKITEIKILDKIFPADRVISDMDVNAFYRFVVPEISAPWSVRLARYSSSAYIFYWGMNRRFSRLDVHNILFSNNYKEEFRHLFKLKKGFDDPTVYLFISSKLSHEDAPEGCENWFVMINVPALDTPGRGLDTEGVRLMVARKIQRVLGIDPLPHIQLERVTTPESLQDMTSSFKGAIYGNNSNSVFSAFMRHSNRSARFKNLFFTGGSVHPGGGIPLCLASAAIVEREMENLPGNH
jgi:phytoene desaturase